MPKNATRETSTAQEDYLKNLYGLAGGRAPVSTAAMAERLGVSAASVSEMYGKLAEKDLVVHDRYRGASLTPTGVSVALEMVRHHRILETFLVRHLGYSWDEVHEEAERLEHAISEKLEARMWEALGRPAFDPHGDPIPAADGALQPIVEVPLTEAKEGDVLRVSRISDRDPAKLRAIEALGLKPGSRLTVRAASQWDGPLELAAETGLLGVPLGLARAVYVNEVR